MTTMTLSDAFAESTSRCHGLVIPIKAIAVDAVRRATSER
jgi:hypothetical protein